MPARVLPAEFQQLGPNQPGGLISLGTCRFGVKWSSPEGEGTDLYHGYGSTSCVPWCRGTARSSRTGLGRTGGESGLIPGRWSNTLWVEAASAGCNQGMLLLNGRTCQCCTRSKSAGKPPRWCWHHSSLWWRDALGPSLQLQHRSREAAKPRATSSPGPAPPASRGTCNLPCWIYPFKDFNSPSPKRMGKGAKKGILSPSLLANTKGQDWGGFFSTQHSHAPCEKLNIGAACLSCALEQTPTPPLSPRLWTLRLTNIFASLTEPK